MDSQSAAGRVMKLQGPRPGPLMVSKSSRKTMKKKHVAGQKQCSSPVVIYLSSPKVFHVKPEEFMGLVQQLTGNLNFSETPNRPESEENSGNGIGQSEHFNRTSRVGPTHALSPDFHTLIHF